MLQQPNIEKIEKGIVPTKFIGLYPDRLDFEEEFEELTDQEKLELVYYIEHKAAKNSGRVGLCIGFVLGIILGVVIGIYVYV